MNIGDIARMAGVSRAAVSRYLNSGYVSDEKRERIRRVIEETGYQPSVMAQTLRTKKTFLIGVILPRVNSDSISSVIEGIGPVLQDAGYNMLLATTDNSPVKELEFLQIFSNHRVDGVILVATVFTEEHKRILKDYALPFVLVGQSLPGFACVYHDDYSAGLLLTRYIIGKGRRNVGYIGVLSEDEAVGQRRFEGVRDALAEGGIPLSPGMRETADFSTESGYERMKALFERRGDIDAVICATDRIALGAMRYLKEAGKRVPEDVAVAGFGDNIVSGVTSPAMTTVRFRYRESGMLAAEKILKEISGGGDDRQQVMLDVGLVPRESV